MMRCSPNTKPAVSTHSRPKAAGGYFTHNYTCGVVSTHSRPKAAGADYAARGFEDVFQHTAARRRLGTLLTPRAI